MAVPFAKTHVALKAERKNFETREALFKLARAFVGSKAARLMADYDRLSTDYGKTQNAGGIFASCFSELPIKAEIYVHTGSPVSLLSILRGAVSRGALREVLLYFAQAAVAHEDALVLFKVKHLGYWAAYNAPDPIRCNVPRVVIPSTREGQSSITMMPLTEYAKMWEIKKGALNAE